MRAVVITSLDEAEPYRERWDRLAVELRQPFASPAWSWAWWEHAAPERAVLRTVLVLDDEDLIAVAPFFSQRRFGAWCYRLLGVGVSGRVDVLGVPDEQGRIANAIATSLSTMDPPPNGVLFEGTPATSPWPTALVAAWPSPRTPDLREYVSMPAPVLDLVADDFDAWFSTKSGHFRSRMRRGLRKLTEAGGSIRLARDDEVIHDIESFVRLHGERWQHRGGSRVVRDGVERMLRDVAMRHRADGRLRIWTIDLSDRTVSVQIFIEAGGEVVYWLGGFEDTFDLRPGPAILTVLREIEHAYACHDARLDLGAGDQPYKYEFASSADHLVWSCIVLKGPRAMLVRAQLLPLTARVEAARRAPLGLKRQARRLRRPRPTRTDASVGDG